SVHPVSRQEGAHVIDGGGRFRNPHPKVARVGEYANGVRVPFVIVLESQPIAAVGRHRHQLIGDAIALFPGELMVVSVEEGGDLVLDEQLMHRKRPSWPAFIERPGGAVLVVASPLGEGNGVRATADVVVRSTSPVVGKDE